MKDRQVEQTPAQLRIPVISSVLHCISMTALVFLRSGFGYAYFRPKSFFIAVSWAFALFSFYAWHEPGVWPGYAALCCYGIAATLLYALHFIWAFANELRGTAKHDNYSGTPHTLRMLRLLEVPVSASFRDFWVTWIEPGAVLVAALVLRFAPVDAQNLSHWLLVVAASLWLKEALNYWLQLRRRKRQRDTMEDAQEGMIAEPARQNPTPAASSRKEKVKRQRAP